MSDLNELKVGRVKGKGILQYASDTMNNPNLDTKDTMAGIKAIAIANRIIEEAILAHQAEIEGVTYKKIRRSPIPTGEEIAEDVKKALYRYYEEKKKGEQNTKDEI